MEVAERVCAMRESSFPFPFLALVSSHFSFLRVFFFFSFPIMGNRPERVGWKQSLRNPIRICSLPTSTPLLSPSGTLRLGERPPSNSRLKKLS